jgi:hypothetical protein
VYFKENSSILFQQNSKLKEVSNLIRFDKIYAISYHWISLIPIIITLIVGIVISILKNGCKQKVDKKYMLFNKSNSKIEEENYELERK